MAILSGVVVGDLVLEKTAAAEVAVFKAVTGHSEGVLLAMAAALGFIVAMLLVASVGLTETRRARCKQLHSLGPSPKVTWPSRRGTISAWMSSSAGKRSSATRRADQADQPPARALTGPTG